MLDLLLDDFPHQVAKAPPLQSRDLLQGRVLAWFQMDLGVMEGLSQALSVAATSSAPQSLPSVGNRYPLGIAREISPISAVSETEGHGSVWGEIE